MRPRVAEISLKNRQNAKIVIGLYWFLYSCKGWAKVRVGESTSCVVAWEPGDVRVELVLRFPVVAGKISVCSISIWWAIAGRNSISVSSRPSGQKQSKTVKRQSKQQKWPLVYQSSHVYQDCTNNVPIVKNSQKTVKTAKMTIGVPIATCLHRVRRIHKVIIWTISGG